MTVQANQAAALSGEIPGQAGGNDQVEGRAFLKLLRTYRGGSYRGPAAGEGPPLLNHKDMIRKPNLLDNILNIKDNKKAADQSAPLTLIGGFFLTRLHLIAFDGGFQQYEGLRLTLLGV